MTRPAEFDRCLRTSATYRQGAFALHLLRIGDPSDAANVGPVWRLGLVIPKRYEATAVGRNTIKRRWRDAFRRRSVAWAGEFGSVDLVVRLQSPLVPKASKLKKAGHRSGGPNARNRAAICADPLLAPLPPKVRARDRFDPGAMLDGLIERLRGGRNGRAAPAAVPMRPAGIRTE